MQYRCMHGELHAVQVHAWRAACSTGACMERCMHGEVLRVTRVSHEKAIIIISQLYKLANKLPQTAMGNAQWKHAVR